MTHCCSKCNYKTEKRNLLTRHWNKFHSGRNSPNGTMAPVSRKERVERTYSPPRAIGAPHRIDSKDPCVRTPTRPRPPITPARPEGSIYSAPDFHGNRLFQLRAKRDTLRKEMLELEKDIEKEEIRKKEYDARVIADAIVDEKQKNWMEEQSKLKKEMERLERACRKYKKEARKRRRRSPSTSSVSSVSSASTVEQRPKKSKTRATERSDAKPPKPAKGSKDLSPVAKDRALEDPDGRLEEDLQMSGSDFDK